MENRSKKNFDKMGKGKWSSDDPNEDYNLPLTLLFHIGIYAFLFWLYNYSKIALGILTILYVVLYTTYDIYFIIKEKNKDNLEPSESNLPNKQKLILAHAVSALILLTIGLGLVFNINILVLISCIVFIIFILFTSYYDYRNSIYIKDKVKILCGNAIQICFVLYIILDLLKTN